MMKRDSGVLLAVSSLPSRYGIGSLGKSAHDFVDFLDATGQTCWQVLPLNPTSYGDSPYQSPASQAGNPYFIDLDLLARKKIQELEGDEGHKHIAEYADGTTKRGQALLKSICSEMGFASLGYQSLDGLLEAVGLDRDKVCTYCWTGEE